ncbi:Argininosuccinate lyase [Trichinella pseudospiralis]
MPPRSGGRAFSGRRWRSPLGTAPNHRGRDDPARLQAGCAGTSSRYPAGRIAISTSRGLDRAKETPVAAVDDRSRAIQWLVTSLRQSPVKRYVEEVARGADTPNDCREIKEAESIRA